MLNTRYNTSSHFNSILQLTRRVSINIWFSIGNRAEYTKYNKRSTSIINMIHIRSLCCFVAVVAAMVHRAGAFQLSKSGKPSNQSATKIFVAQAGSKEKDNSAPPLTCLPPRKICLMVEPTPFTHVSGYSNRFKEMLRFLSKAGDQVEIVTTDDTLKTEELPTESFGYPIYHTQGFQFKLYQDISLTLDLPEMKGVRIIEKLKPDLIHATSPGFLVMAAVFYARVLRVPCICSYHTHLPLYGRNYLGFIPGIEAFAWWLIRQVHTRCDLTLVTSSQMKEELEAHGVPRVSVWRKGIDVERFNPKFKDAAMRNKMADGNPDDFLMIYIGRLGAEKRLKDIKPVLERLPNARLCLVGKGPYKEELEKHFKGTNTIFMGQLGGDELSQAFASADAFVMPSDSETLGFVVLEAMASGVPVVSNICI